MEKKFSWKRIAEIVLFCSFVSAPIIFMSGYAVYWFRSWLADAYQIEIPEPVYLMLLFFVMWGAMWLSTGKLIAKIRGEQGKASCE